MSNTTNKNDNAAAKRYRELMSQERRARREAQFFDDAYINSSNGNVSHFFRSSKEQDTVDYMKRFLKTDESNNIKYTSFDQSKVIGSSVGISGQKTGLHDDLVEEFNKINSSKASKFDKMERLQSISNARNRTKMEDIFGSLSDKTTAVKAGGGVNNQYGFTSMESFARAGVLDHARRAAQFASFRGVKDDFLNTIGIRTAHQKNIIASASASKLDKVMAGAPAALGAVFSMSEAMQYAVGDKETTITDNALTSVTGLALSSAASTYAFRVTKEATHTATSFLKVGKLASESYRSAETVGKLGWGGRVMGGAKWLTGTAVGLAAGGAAFMAVQEAVDIFKSSADRENAVTRLKDKLYTGDTRGDASINTRQALTSRQRSIQKLSKSSLNDKAYLLGNEAMILKGIY